ncbi:MAG: hypothetical protein IJF75_00165 [Clostridia bacterium]|nr:hypothetical protein [Clostridia bacterium]
MKKLAILIATLLIVCLMACACGTVEETSTPDSTSESTQTQTSTPTSEAPKSEAPKSEAPTSQAPSTPSTPSAGGSTVKFDTIVANTTNSKGADAFTGEFNGLTITAADVKVSSGKPAKSGSLNGTVFTGNYLQLGKNGSATNKCISFTASQTGTVEIYANCGSTGVEAGVLYFGSESVSNVKNSQLDAFTFSVTAGTTYTLYAGAAGSINVFAIVGI